MDVYSRIDEGSSFRIYLPIIEDEPVEVSLNPSVTTSRGETVLLAEDDPLVRELGRRMLEKAGYQVITAADGKEALDLYQAQADRIDLIVMDIVMPQLTGREVLEALRRQGARVPICFCTGYDPTASQSESLRSLGFEVAEKPFNEHHLLEMVRGVLDSHSANPSAPNERPPLLTPTAVSQ
jgi:CheY-like chemotaxis protein